MKFLTGVKQLLAETADEQHNDNLMWFYWSNQRQYCENYIHLRVSVPLCTACLSKARIKVPQNATHDTDQLQTSVV